MRARAPRRGRSGRRGRTIADPIRAVPRSDRGTRPLAERRVRRLVAGDRPEPARQAQHRRGRAKLGELLVRIALAAERRGSNVTIARAALALRTRQAAQIEACRCPSCPRSPARSCGARRFPARKRPACPASGTTTATVALQRVRAARPDDRSRNAAGQAPTTAAATALFCASRSEGRSSFQLASCGEGTQDASAVTFPHIRSWNVQLPTAPPSKSQAGSLSSQRCLRLNDPSEPRRGVLLGLSTDHRRQTIELRRAAAGNELVLTRRRAAVAVAEVAVVALLAAAREGEAVATPERDLGLAGGVAAVTRGEVAVVARLVAVDHGVAAAGGRQSVAAGVRRRVVVGGAVVTDLAERHPHAVAARRRSRRAISTRRSRGAPVPSAQAFMKRPVSWKVRIREADRADTVARKDAARERHGGDPLRLPSAATLIARSVLPPSVQAT